MADVLKLRLPLPPSVNHYYKHRGIIAKNNGRPKAIRYLSQHAKDYRYTVAEHVWEQLGSPPKLEGRLAMTVRISPRNQGQKQDIDNGLKSLLDSLEYALVYKNDSQIDQLLLIRGRKSMHGHVDIEIKTI